MNCKLAFGARAFPLTALAGATVLSLLTVPRSASAADTVVQIPVDTLIDGRSVSTLAGTTVLPWSAGQGVDGDGYADGFVTSAVEAALATQGKTVGGKANPALPDDGLFPATARYPAIQLHFSNAASNTSPQTHQVHISSGAQSFQFAVPPASYSKMFLVITCSEGAANLTITLNYGGGLAPVVTLLNLPDYGVGGAPANDAVFFNLISGMHKWTAADQETDTTTHTITGIELDPLPTATLTSIQVAKTNGSHVVFWGATGVATSTVGTGSGGSGGAGGASGAAGAGGIGGTGTGGTTAAAGASSVAGTSATAQAGSSATGTVAEPDTNTESGCSLSVAPTKKGAAWAACFVGCAFALKRWRRSRRGAA